MARIRTIKPEFWEDDIVGSLSLGARLLFIATWNAADDEGLLRWSPEYLRSLAFRYDDKFTVDDVAEWMRELEHAGFIYVYATSRARGRLGYIVNFRRHQRIDKPQGAKMPPPNWREADVVMMYARRDGFECRACKDPVNERFATDDEWRRYNPVCRLIKARFEGGSDDPTNVAVVHVCCANGPSEGGRIDAPDIAPGPFQDDSQNDPGIFADRSGDPLTGLADAGSSDADIVSEINDDLGIATGQSIPGTFLEESATDKEGNREGKRKGTGKGTPSARTDETNRADAEASDADKPRGAETSKTVAKRKRTKPTDPEDVEREEAARKILKWWWDQQNPKPAGEKAWFTSLAVIVALLKAGHDRHAICVAAADIGTPLTINRMEIQLGRIAGRNVIQLPAQRPGPNDAHLAAAMERAQARDAAQAANPTSQTSPWKAITG